MSFTADTLPDRLTALLPAARPPARFLVAFSGGLDSSVLLHSLAACRERLQGALIAVHVNHGLHPQADDWEAHCRQFAGDLGLEFHSRLVAVAEDSGQGPEAAARQARYAALLDCMQPGDCLLSAHHEDDQAETLLLNLMRGSGVAGLAGIPASQPFGPGLLLRPLLDVPGEALREYARGHSLVWVDDPSNAETRFDRNFLRNEVVPRLAERWPAVTTKLVRSAGLATEAAGLLSELAEIDLADAGIPSRLSVRALRQLSAPRQRNLLRHAIRRCGLPPAPATRLSQAVEELLPARADAQPLVCWPGAELRRYRDSVFVMPALSEAPAPGNDLCLVGEAPLPLGRQAGQLRLQAGAEMGIERSYAEAGLAVRYRRGGESIRPLGSGNTRRLRTLMQDAGIVPWMRERIPLLYAGDTLVAVADLWLARDCAAPQGYAVCWDDKPVLS